MINIYLEKTNGIFGKIINFITGKDVNHCFLGFNDYFIEAGFWGVRIFDIQEFSNRNIINKFVYSGNLPEDHEIQIALMFIFLKNKPYDYLLTLSHLWKKINVINSFNCVEIVYYICYKLGMQMNFNPYSKPHEIDLRGVNGWS